MEKSVTIILICCFSLVLKAQDSLCVFNIKGTAYTKISNQIKPVKKGTFINSNSTLIVDQSSKITAISAKGSAYRIEEDGNYKFSQVLSHKIEDSESLTMKYLKLIWNEFTQKESNKTIIGGVFRGDVLMEQPQDSAKWASSKLTFKWKSEPDSSDYYLFIRNKTTDEFFKLATKGSQVVLYKDQHIFMEGTEFEWTVSHSEFPNLNNIPFFSFTLIDKNTYLGLKSNYKEMVADLKRLGLTDSEIESSICETYRLCK